MFKQRLICWINRIITFVGMLFPHKNYVICGGWYGRRFADNSKAFFLYLARNKEKLDIERVIYVANNESIYEELKKAGFDVVRMGTIKSKLLHLKAKYHIIDQGALDVEKFCSCAAVRVNLWHGFPLKCIGYSAQFPDKNYEDIMLYNNKFHVSGKWNHAYNLVQSKKQARLHEKAFGIPKQQLLLGVYPRVAYMRDIIPHFYLEAEKENITRLNALKEKEYKVIGYFPTFRDDEMQNQKCIDLCKQLVDFLEEKDVYLLTKMHFAAKTSSVLKNERIINLLPESDIYNFLDKIDVLITDYSSIYFDFLLMDKPIIFYSFDLDYYMEQDRGFNFDYDSITPGEKVSDVKGVINTIEVCIRNPQKYMESWSVIRDNTLKLVYDSTNPSVTETDMDMLWNSIKECEVI